MQDEGGNTRQCSITTTALQTRWMSIFEDSPGPMPPHFFGWALDGWMDLEILGRKIVESSSCSRKGWRWWAPTKKGRKRVGACDEVGLVTWLAHSLADERVTSDAQQTTAAVLSAFIALPASASIAASWRLDSIPLLADRDPELRAAARMPPSLQSASRAVVQVSPPHSRILRGQQYGVTSQDQGKRATIGGAQAGGSRRPRAAKEHHRAAASASYRLQTPSVCPYSECMAAGSGLGSPWHPLICTRANARGEEVHGMMIW